MAKDFIKTWDGRRLEDWGCVVSKEFKQFQSAFKREVKRLAEEKGANLVGYSNGHYDMCGFVEQNGKYVYFSYGSLDRTKVSLTPNGNWHSAFLMRTAKSAKDYHGGTNNHVAFSQFQEIMERLFQQQQSAAATQEQTITIETTNQQSNQTTNNMEANNIKAADLIGKTIIVGENIATIVIKSANGNTLQGEYKSGNAQAVIIPISVERLFENLKAGTWKVDEPHEEPQDVVVPTTTEDGFAEFEEIKDDPNGDGDPDAIGEIVNAEGQESQSDDPVMQQWKEAKAKNPDAVTIFRSNGVYVVISDDATKVSEVTRLPTQNHGDVPICLFPVDKLQQIMSQLVRSGVRVRIDDLVQAPTEEPCAEAQDVEPIEEEATEEATPTPTVKPRVLPRTAPKEEAAKEADEADGAEETDEVEEVADVPTEEQTDEPEPPVEAPKPAPRHGEVTAKPEAGHPHIINYGKSIVVAGDTSRIEAVLMTLWGRKRPYTRSGVTYSGIQMSAKHMKTVQEIIKLVAC